MEILAKAIIDAARPSAFHGGGGPFGGSGLNLGFSSGGAKWANGLSADGVPPLYDHWRLRANGRRAYQDSSAAQLITKRTADLTAHIGLKFFSSPDWKTLGISREEAQMIGDRITKIHHSYSLSKKQHRAGLMNLYQSQRLYQIIRVRDGENFIRQYYSKDTSLISGVQFNIIDPNQIIGDAVTSGYLPFFCRDGINRNDKGEEKSYDIWSIKGNGEITPTTIPRIGARSGRIFMLHCFAPEFPGQNRGYSSLGTSAQDFQNIENFLQATTQKGINQSHIMMYGENQQMTPGNPTGQGLISSGFPTGGDPNPTKISDAELRCANPQFPVLRPGSIAFFNLTQGDKLIPFPNTAPATGFKEFQDSYIGYMAALKGLPLSVMKMEFTKSYSASRGELLLAWNGIEVERGEMISDFLNPNLESILSEEVGRGRMRLPGWSDPLMRMAWMMGVWFGSSVPNIDPKKEADANILNWGKSFTTGQEIARNINGSDLEANMETNRITFENLPTAPWEKSSSGDDVQDDEDEDDEDDD